MTLIEIGFSVLLALVLVFCAFMAAAKVINDFVKRRRARIRQRG